MKLADLNPRWSQCYREFTPERGGIDPLPMVQLTFRCPKCGSHYAHSIYVTTGEPDQSKARWHGDSLPTSVAWPETVTITPSIQAGLRAHGSRGPDCGAHFSIIKGEIVP